MPSATSSSASSPPPSALTENAVYAHLNQRRKDLDDEVAAFRARKDDEFRSFADNLWAEYRGQDANGEDGAADGKHDTGSAAAAGVTTPTGEKDELRALFNPSFLPLLEASASSGTPAAYASNPPVHKRKAHSSSSSSKSSPPRSIPKSSSRRSKRSPSPPSSPPPSSQAQHGTILERPRLDASHRRSSSHSSASSASHPAPGASGTQLRSSLRQPRSPDLEGAPTARSPRTKAREKHVLFNIDDAIISPSSSPVAVRESGSDGGGGGTRASAVAGASPAAFTTTTSPSTASATSASTAPSTPAAPAHPPPRPGPLSLSSSPTPPSPQPNMSRAYAALGTAPAASVGEQTDDALLDVPGSATDPLFEFDDDVGFGEVGDEPLPGQANVNREEERRAEGDGEGFGRSWDEGRKGARAERNVTRVGSLPIEIRWPGPGSGRR